MARTHRRLLPTAILLAVALVLALATTVLADSPRNFTAPMSGDQETAEVDTQATGVAHFQLDRDGDALSFRVNVANIENVTQAHIHAPAPLGEDAPVVAWLYPEAPPEQLIPGRFDGTLATGVITGDDLVGTLEGEDLDVLMDLIRDGLAYVNVHTSQFPPGEIRGQIDRPRGHIGG